MSLFSADGVGTLSLSSINDAFFKQSINIENWIYYKNKNICCDRLKTSFVERTGLSATSSYFCFQKTLSVLKHMMSYDTMIYEIGKDLEGSGHGLIKLLSQHLPGGLRKPMKNFSPVGQCPG